MDNPPALTLAQALTQHRLPEFIKQAEARLIELGAEHPEATKWRLSGRRLKPSDQKIEHKVAHVPVVRPERELVQIALHVLLRHVDVR